MPIYRNNRGLVMAPNVRMGAVADAQPAPDADPIEEELIISLDTTLAALQRIPDLGKDIDKEGDVWLTHVWGSSTGTYDLILRFHNGRSLMTSAVHNTNFVGSAQFKVGIRPMFFPAGSRLSVDLTDTSNAQNTIQLIFGAIRRLKNPTPYRG